MLPAKQTLRLIHWLSTLSQDDLRTLVHLRGLKAHDLQSLTTLAQALLDEASVQATLRSLSRASVLSLKALAAGEKTSKDRALVERGLVDDSGEAPELLIADHVVTGIAVSDEALPTIDTAVATPELGGIAGSVIESTLCCLEDLLEIVETHSVSTNKDGTLGPSGTKAIQEVVGDTPDPGVLVSLAVAARLCSATGGRLHPGPESGRWKSMTRLDQWRFVADAWWKVVPPDVTSLVIDNPTATWTTGLPTLLDYHYPLGDHSGLPEILAQAEVLGLHVHGVTTPFGVAIATSTSESHLSALFPEHVPGVYATEDFTMLAPGPLQQDHRAVLGRLADKELGGLVPRFRITSASLIRALHRGEKAEGIVEALRGVCQNPLPEGIVHLVEDTIRQTKAITITSLPTGSLVTVESEQRGDELLADPSLSMLGLSRQSPTEFHTKWPPERTSAALHAAKYVSLVDLAPSHSVVTPEAPAASSDIDQAIEVLHRSIELTQQSGVSAALSSIIEVATANRIPLVIECDMGSAGHTQFVIEPRSVSNGRLRGIETRHNVERTIPVASIVQATPWSTPENTGPDSAK